MSVPFIPGKQYRLTRDMGPDTVFRLGGMYEFVRLMDEVDPMAEFRKDPLPPSGLFRAENLHEYALPLDAFEEAQ